MEILLVVAIILVFFGVFFVGYCIGWIERGSAKLSDTFKPMFFGKG